jgi:hypothetical protein
MYQAADMHIFMAAAFSYLGISVAWAWHHPTYKRIGKEDS